MSLQSSDARVFGLNPVCQSDAQPDAAKADDFQKDNLQSFSSVSDYQFAKVISNPEPVSLPRLIDDVVKRARRLGGCTRCLSPNHNCFNCFSAPRCATCIKIGHKFKSCFKKRRPEVSAKALPSAYTRQR